MVHFHPGIVGGGAMFMLSCVTLFRITEVFNLLFVPSLLSYLLPTLPIILLTTSITVNGNLWEESN